MNSTKIYASYVHRHIISIQDLLKTMHHIFVNLTKWADTQAFHFYTYLQITFHAEYIGSLYPVKVIHKEVRAGATVQWDRGCLACD